jgi:primosomal replication protein N
MRHEKKRMILPKIEKFSLQAIADAVSGSDLPSARLRLSFAVGSLLEVSGKCLKRVRREGLCRLVIEPGDVLDFVVFADCLSDTETVIKRKIRKGSLVRVKGRLQSFGAMAVCLSDCRLVNQSAESAS